ncbi:hypothetical protein ABL78_6189 [Leptomonas seymouri]|uniref:SH3 domain-containing protein n=1 Tax=Leptomonas seymouri TaxID=5684 RepID=A0A0N1IJ47_LEPSE|nr:hypothetical protein ABL78_6189 [Leptomonas seymouri]|eukprot:KPI84771.1 hypothetical protein ABL78_6189 [Leptomonas seymouri]
MVQPAEHVVYAIHDYEIPGKGFLPLKAGDVLYVVDADSSGWWLGVNLRRQKGVFPSTYTLPYVFPQPPADLVRDVQLLFLAREFQVDLTSGSPAPLYDLEAAPHSAHPSVPSADLLRDELQQLLLERETERKTVMDRLGQLLDAQERGRAMQQQEMMAQRVREQKCECEKEQLHKARTLLRDLVGDIDRQKKELLSKCKVPSQAWYCLFAKVVAVAGADSNADAEHSCESVWRDALKDLKSVVQQQEEQLAALSSSCEEKEAAFTEAAAALQKRIEWRDNNVAAMLAYWADAAAQTKSMYVSCKTEREAANVVHQQKAAELRRRLTEGKERYSETKEKYRTLKREAQTISDLLKQQDTLDALSREVAEVDGEMAALQPCA